MTSSEIGKIIFKEELYELNKSKYNRIIFSTLHRYSDPNSDLTFFSNDRSIANGSYWTMADSFQIEKSWAHLNDNNQKRKNLEFHRGNIKDSKIDEERANNRKQEFFHMYSEYLNHFNNAKISKENIQNADKNLLTKLKKWRSQKSTELGVPAYIVFKDSVLDEIAKKNPKDKKEFSKIKGVGVKKIEQFYEDIAEILKYFEKRKRPIKRN